MTQGKVVIAALPTVAYLRQVQAKISERWLPPGRPSLEASTQSFCSRSDEMAGSRSPHWTGSSGNAIYDQSALRAGMEAGRFPPLPPEFRGPDLKVRFGFEFRPK